MDINEIWEKLENGKIINWHNSSYRVQVQDGNKYNKDHFAYKDGKVFVIVHDEGHQCLLSKCEIKYLYNNEEISNVSNNL
jgi:hypothetical protein